MPIDIDFRKDYSLMLKEKLCSLGIEIDQTIPIEKIPYIYYNFEKRRISQQTRKVMKADDFTCPHYLLSGLDNLERKIVAGDDLTPHLSKRVFMEYTGVDYLLNDWGIHHLHLGIKMRKKFVTRTTTVLFCIVTEEVIYFLTTKPHKEWTDRSLLTIVYKNWPDLIKPFTMSGVISLLSNPDNEDIKNLRKGNISYSIELEHGVVIYPPGGGYATDGTSRDVVTNVHRIMRMLTDFEERIKSNESNIKKQIINNKKTPFRTLKIKLINNKDSLIAYEIYSKMMFYYDDVPFG
jgi:hypothetical protein